MAHIGMQNGPYCGQIGLKRAHHLQETTKLFAKTKQKTAETFASHFYLVAWKSPVFCVIILT